MKLFTFLPILAVCLTTAKSNPNPDPQFSNLREEGCGPPKLVPNWTSNSVREGETFTLRCPLDTRNSCLVDVVEWYFSKVPTDKGQLMRDAAVVFDPLIMVIDNARKSEEGWYTCVVGNRHGKNEISTKIEVIPQGRNVRVSPTQMYPRPQAMPQPLVAKPTETINRQLYNARRQQNNVNEWRNLQENPVRDGGRANDAVNLKFPVYSRFRGNRGFQGPIVPSVPINSRPDPTTPSPRMAPQNLMRLQQSSSQRPKFNSGPRQEDAIYQHLRYMYDKLDDIQSQLTTMDRKIRTLENHNRFD